MGRIADIAHIRAQDGAISGSRGTFLGVILGPHKIDVGEAEKANRGSVWGVQHESNLGLS